MANRIELQINRVIPNEHESQTLNFNVFSELPVPSTKIFSLLDYCCN